MPGCSKQNTIVSADLMLWGMSCLMFNQPKHLLNETRCRLRFNAGQICWNGAEARFRQGDTGDTGSGWQNEASPWVCLTCCLGIWTKAFLLAFESCVVVRYMLGVGSITMTRLLKCSFKWHMCCCWSTDSIFRRSCLNIEFELNSTTRGYPCTVNNVYYWVSASRGTEPRSVTIVRFLE